MSSGGKRYLYNPIQYNPAIAEADFSSDDLLDVYDQQTKKVYKIPVSLMHKAINQAIADMQATQTAHADKLKFYVGHYATLNDLQLANTTPADGYYGSIADKDSFVVYDAATSQWKQLSSGARELIIPVNSDIDNDHGPVLFVGPINELIITLPAVLTSVAYKAKLDSSSVYTDLADLTALQNWINTNVLAATTKWNLIYIGTGSGTFSETSFIFSYKKV